MSFGFRYYQPEAVEAAFRRWDAGDRGTLLWMATGTGKAQPLNAGVLTPSGWTSMGSLSVGDEVVGGDGFPCRVTGVFPQGEKEIFDVTFSDETETQCCGEHLWAVQTKSQKHRKGDTYEVRETASLVGSLYDGGGSAKWFVPVVFPVHFTEKPLPIHPYALGCLLGDGGLTRGYVTLSTADDFILEQVTARLGVNANRCGLYDWRLVIGRTKDKATLHRDLKSLGLMGKLSHEKFIPPDYLFSSVADRVAILRGLMDTDGYCGSEGVGEFSSTSPQLAADVCEIVRSLGGCTKVRVKPPGRYTHKGEYRTGRISYRVTVNLGTINPFMLPRKADKVRLNTKQGRTKAITSIQPAGKAVCQCISVDSGDHLYVTDGYNVTHNTAVAAMTARKAIVERKWRVLFIAHREDLLDGAAGAFKRELHEMQILFELNIDRVYEREIDAGSPDAVVASVQSIHRRLEKYPPDFFDLIIVDESHRAAAQTYLKIVHHFPAAKLLYLTATPKRSDRKTLAGYTYDENEKPNAKAMLASCCEDTAFSMNLGQAIADGWLVEPVPRIVEVNVDWSTLKLKGKDYDQDQLDKIMKEDDQLHKVANGLKELVSDKCGVVFMPGVASAHGLASMLCKSYGIDAVALDGKTEKHLRREIVARVKDGRQQCFVNCNIATEGFDSPYWEYVANCQPTKHVGRQIQIIGRAVRPISGDLFDGIGGRGDRQARLEAIANSSKPKAMVLDFVGKMGQLPRISSKDVLLGELPHKDYGGQPKPSEANVKHVLGKRPDLSIADARQRASDELYMRDILMQPRYEANVQAEVKVQEFESFFSIPFVWQPKGNGQREYKTPAPGKEASEKQLNFIKFLYRQQGRPTPTKEWLESLTKGAAGAIISSMKGAKV